MREDISFADAKLPPAETERNFISFFPAQRRKLRFFPIPYSDRINKNIRFWYLLVLLGQHQSRYLFVTKMDQNQLEETITNIVQRAMANAAVLPPAVNADTDRIVDTISYTRRFPFRRQETEPFSTYAPKDFREFRQKPNSSVCWSCGKYGHFYSSCPTRQPFNASFSAKNNKSSLNHPYFVEDTILKLLRDRCVEEIEERPYICNPLTVAESS